MGLPFEDHGKEITFSEVRSMLLSWNQKSSYSYTSRVRPSHALMLILCDKIRIEYQNGAVVFFNKGDIIYIPKGIRYTVKFLGEGDKLEAFLINFLIGREYAELHEVVRLVENAGVIFHEHFKKTTSLYVRTNNRRYALMAEFYSLLSDLGTNAIKSAEAPIQRSGITPAIEYINSHVGKPISIPDLAKLCLLSESAFRKRFLESIGKTPKKYISDLKVKKAAELITSTDIPISSVASELGFYDCAYFHKLFKKRYGRSPGDFRAGTVKTSRGPE
jgi:AraC-like DNA-binding protein